MPSSTGGLRRTASHPELPTKSAKSSSNLMEHDLLSHLSWLRNTTHSHHTSSVAKKRLPTHKCCESKRLQRLQRFEPRKACALENKNHHLNCYNLTFNANHIMPRVRVKYKILQLQCQYVLYIYNCIYIYIY